MFNALKRFTDSIRLVRRIKDLEAQVTYLLDETSDLRALVRQLLPESERYQRQKEQTYASFDYQWKTLNVGDHTIADDSFKSNGVALLEQYTTLPRAWFTGKKVLDAGCGGGRWSWVLASVGARVTAIDQGASCVEATRAICQDFPHVEVRQHSVLEPLNSPAAFDLVWSYGVVHHTGDTHAAIRNLAQAVKPGGYFFLMVYGEPRRSQRGDFSDVNEYVRLRRLLAAMSLDERVAYLKTIKDEGSVHGWFDAVSPRINDLHRFDEIAEWLHQLDFTDIRETQVNRNHHIIARRK